MITEERKEELRRELVQFEDLKNPEGFAEWYARQMQESKENKMAIEDLMKERYFTYPIEKIAEFWRRVSLKTLELMGSPDPSEELEKIEKIFRESMEEAAKRAGL